MKVVVFDSNLITSSRVSRSLKEAGFEVDTTNSLEKLRRTLSEENVKVVFINLEGANGIEILKLLKNEFPNVKIISFCGHKNSELQKRAKELGSDIVVSNSAVVSSPKRLIEELSL